MSYFILQKLKLPLVNRNFLKIILCALTVLIVLPRYWLTADTLGECSEWSRRINQVLSDLRAWHPYANPSVRVPLDEIPFQ